MCGNGPSAIALPTASPSAQPVADAGRDDVVQPAGFLPQAELAGADVPGDALGGGPDEGELPVVDRPGPVHGDVVDQAALHQVDQVPLHARPAGRGRP